MDTIARCGIVEEPYKENDGTGNVDEGVYTVGPAHEEGVVEEPALKGGLVEEVQTLLEVDKLESVPACDVDGAFDHCYGAEGAAELVDLASVSVDLDS
jgi:hypothetical protein